MDSPYSVNKCSVEERFLGKKHTHTHTHTHTQFLGIGKVTTFLASNLNWSIKSTV